MLTVDDIKRWLIESDHSQKWLARECSVDVRTVQNWMSSEKIPPKQEKRIWDLMAMESETLHVVRIKLRNPDFNRLKKKAASEDIPLDEYCARVVMSNLDRDGFR